MQISIIDTPTPLRLRPEPSRRRHIWELASLFHCSIIGTCLSTNELRRLLRKLGQDAPDATDHTLHGLAVSLAGRHDQAGKLLNKALDERHRAVVRRFDAATEAEGVRQLWREALEAGDIPGAYWAALTHPATDQPLISEIFGEVHMLSHLVGAANRADIRRLAMQEREIAALRETVARQQARLRDDLTERDARIRTLQEVVAQQSLQSVAQPCAADRSEIDMLIAELRRQLDREVRRREALEHRLTEAETTLQSERAARAELQHKLQSTVHELAIVEQELTPHVDEKVAVPPAALGTVLYVGGRSGQTALLRHAAERCGAAAFLHHDAEQGASLLPGLVSRADVIVFPVDCVSHDAALAVKRLCRQLGREFLPLRSSGAASLMAALRHAAAMTVST
ncbi:DUF2325 domain-containing protein [Paracraurococcus lichenis]|uniref:DUF2325 domain-containing protein n=1 Tax=Paracraurococcus lichenis TaxID=3064888 RepID=A0ABT9EAW5_9PROT|nr:DUF2325 domain-containing protein [Paracraurococcus sp. LOR1-02]MDO9713277.1 DUF2325 domain-containing protein [Paracraurococcus sp. LOR1-02]